MVRMNLAQIASLGDPQSFALDNASWPKVGAAHTALMMMTSASHNPVYGLHTHYGHNVKDLCDAREFQSHQLQLLHYLLVGTGTVLSARVVRRALRLQALKCAQGFSGVHPETVRDLVNLSNRAEMSAVPSQGSLGASGDLVPMAHAISSLFKNQQPRGPRDVIGLVNTNAMMASFAVELHTQTSVLMRLYLELLPFLLHAAGAPLDAYDIRLFASREPHPSTVDFLRSLQTTVSSFASPGRPVRKSMLQHRYSLRVTPMLIDTFHKSLDFAGRLINEEALAVADNPIIILDSEASAEAIHGGLFYSSSLAVAADALTDIQSKLGEMMDRQILILMDPELSGSLPNNLEA